MNAGQFASFENMNRYEGKAKGTCQMVIDLYHAQRAANDGRVDVFEMKKAVLKELGFEGAEGVSPNMLPKRMDQLLERVIYSALFLDFAKRQADATEWKVLEQLQNRGIRWSWRVALKILAAKFNLAPFRQVFRRLFRR